MKHGFSLCKDWTQKDYFYVKKYMKIKLPLDKLISDNDPEVTRNLDNEQSPQDVSISAIKDKLKHQEHTTSMVQE